MWRRLKQALIDWMAPGSYPFVTLECPRCYVKVRARHGANMTKAVGDHNRRYHRSR